MSRWTKVLAQRLYKEYGNRYILINSGISGNSLIYEPKEFIYKSFGRMGMYRYQRDVLSFNNVGIVILAFGINDISFMTKKNAKTVNLGNLIKATTELTDILHSKGIRVVCQTLGPRKGYQKFTDEMESIRKEYNQLVRSCGILII